MFFSAGPSESEDNYFYYLRKPSGNSSATRLGNKLQGFRGENDLWLIFQPSKPCDHAMRIVAMLQFAAMLQFNSSTVRDLIRDIAIDV